MEGYYDSEYSGKGLKVPTGQLKIDFSCGKEAISK